MPSMRRVFGNEHGRILAIPADSDNVLFTYPNGKRVFAEADAFRIDPLSAHHMKEITPVMTNGVTFEDIIADKGAMNIFPSQHISAGATRSVLKNWAQYVQNLTHVYETYCVSTDSELNIQINPEGNLTNPLILDHNKHPEIKDQITSGDFDPMKFAKDTGQHYFFNTQGLEEAMQIIAQQDQE